VFDDVVDNMQAAMAPQGGPKDRQKKKDEVSMIDPIWPHLDRRHALRRRQLFACTLCLRRHLVVPQVQVESKASKV